MTKNTLFQEKLNEKDMYLTRAQMNKKYGYVPVSVTKVIRSSKTKREQTKLKELLRDPNSELAKATKRGRKVHQAFETGIIKDAHTQKVVDVFRKDILADIDEVWGQEKSIIHNDHKYCGIFDGVGIYKGKLTLFDYKKTNKAKKNNSSMRNYLLQLCAYKKAHDSMYPDFEIEQVALFNIYGKHIDEVATNIKILTKDEIDEHTDRFYQHLYDYQTGIKECV
tara:strand:+ start:536 stop:1204 length:669 start_codon:yes stop_codon:yes gene_type:complete